MVKYYYNSSCIKKVYGDRNVIVTQTASGKYNVLIEIAASQHETNTIQILPDASLTRFKLDGVYWITTNNIYDQNGVACSAGQLQTYSESSYDKLYNFGVSSDLNFNNALTIKRNGDTSAAGLNGLRYLVNRSTGVDQQLLSAEIVSGLTCAVAFINFTTINGSYITTECYTRIMYIGVTFNNWVEVPSNVIYRRNYTSSDTTTKTELYVAYKGEYVTIHGLPTSWQRDGYYFKGWTEDQGGTGRILSPGSSFENASDYHITLYAKWEEKAKNYEIQSHVDGGYTDRGSISPYSIVAQKGDSRTFTATVNDGYYLSSWYLSPSNCATLSTSGNTATVTISGTTGGHLYARILQRSSVKVQFLVMPDGAKSLFGIKYKGSSGDWVETNPNQYYSFYVGETISLTPKEPTESTRFSFSTWDTAQKYNVTFSDPTSKTCSVKFTGGSTIHIYCVCVEDTSAQVIMGVSPDNSGTTTPPIGTNEVTRGEPFDITATPNDGYKFVEWYTTTPSYVTITDPASQITTATVNDTVGVVAAKFEVDTRVKHRVTVEYYGDVHVASKTKEVEDNEYYSSWYVYDKNRCTLEEPVLLYGDCDKPYNTDSGSLIVNHVKSDCYVRISVKQKTPITPSEFSTSQMKRYKVLICKSINCYLFSRSINNKQWFSNLKYTDVLDGVGSGSLTIHSKSDIVSDTCLAIGNPIYILDNGMPIYAGIITSLKKTENNYFYSHTAPTINEYAVGFSSGIRMLNHVNGNNLGSMTSSPGVLAHLILGENYCGIIEPGLLTTTFNVDSNNRLSQMDKLRDNTGWRYRCRPYIVGHVVSTSLPSFYNTLPGDIYISSDTKYDGRVRVSTDLSSVYNDGREAHYYVLRKFVVDFRPSFYQQDSVNKSDSALPTSVRKAWGTNYSAFDNNDSSLDIINYGKISVSSSQYNGMTYTSSIPLVQEHMKDKSITNSTYITGSIDSPITEYTFDKENGRLEFYIYGDEDVTLSEWVKAPDMVNMSCTYVGPVSDIRGYTVYHDLKDNIATVDTGKAISIKKFTSPIKMMLITIELATKEPLYEALIAGREIPNGILGNGYKVYNRNVLPVSTDGTGTIYLGSEFAVFSPTPYYPNNIVIYRDIPDSAHALQTPIPMHRSGVLVQCATTNPNSPYAKFGDRALCVEMQSGYTIMDTDYMASNYAVFGSNFDSSGSCNVPLIKFKKEDSTYMFNGMLQPGDHICIYKSTSLSTADNYELLQYTVEFDNMMVSVKYGTKTLDLNGMLYNVRKNTTMTLPRS